MQTSTYKEKRKEKMRCTQLGRSQRLNEHKERVTICTYKQERRRVLRSPRKKKKEKEEKRKGKGKKDN